MIPMHVAMDGVDRAEQPGPHRFANVAEVRRPAGVLVDGELHAHFVGQIGQPLADIQIEHKRLLAEHMLARPQRGFDDRRPLGRMRRDVDDLDIVARQHIFDVVGRDRIRIKLIAPLPRALERQMSHNASTR